MQQRPTLQEAYSEILFDAQARRFTAQTLRFHRGRLSLFIKWCEGEGITQLAEPTHTHCRRYLAGLSARSLSSAYIHFYRGRLKLFLAFCEQQAIDDITHLTHHHIRQYLVCLQETGVSSAYQHSPADFN